MKKPNTVERKYWVIKNAKTGCIWKQIYHSFYDANEELRYQTSVLSQGKTAKNWKIEEGTYMGDKDGLDDF